LEIKPSKFIIKLIKNFFTRYKITQILKYNDKKIDRIEKLIEIIISELELDNKTYIDFDLQEVNKLFDIEHKNIKLFSLPIQEKLNRYSYDINSFNKYYKKMSNEYFDFTDGVYYTDLIMLLPNYSIQQFISRWLMIFTGYDYKIENKFRKIKRRINKWIF